MSNTVVGLTHVKINGIYDLAFRNASWQVDRAETTHVTGGGPKQGIGVSIPSGSCDEVIDEGQTGIDWANLKDFSVEILSKEKKTVIFSADGCNWKSSGGSTDLSQASTTKRIAWAGTGVVKF